MILFGYKVIAKGYYDVIFYRRLYMACVPQFDTMHPSMTLGAFEVSFHLFFAIFFRQDFKIGFKCRSKSALAVIADSPCNLRNAFIGFF